MAASKFKLDVAEYLVEKARESIEVGESTWVVLGGIQQTGGGAVFS